MGSSGKSLELYFIDGKPDGMLTATVPFQWTGHVLMTSRNQIAEALKRDEAARTGVYILMGEIEDGLQIYIGETEEIRLRIKQHAKNKEWWTSAILISDTGNELNKAHVKYLESRLIETATNVAKASLENGTIPPLPSLSEAQKANMEGFLENIFTVLPALRVDCFLKETRTIVEAPKNSNVQPDSGTYFELRTPKNGVTGEAVLQDGEFIVLKGSIGRREWYGSMSHNYRKLFEKMVEQGLIELDGEHAKFAENYAFTSPIAAGAMLNGRATNGRTAWKHKGTKQTYHDWENERLAETE